MAYDIGFVAVVYLHVDRTVVSFCRPGGPFPCTRQNAFLRELLVDDNFDSTRVDPSLPRKRYEEVQRIWITRIQAGIRRRRIWRRTSIVVIDNNTWILIVGTTLSSSIAFLMFRQGISFNIQRPSCSWITLVHAWAFLSISSQWWWPLRSVTLCLFVTTSVSSILLAWL